MATNFPFVKARIPAFIISGLLLVCMYVFTFVQGGFNLGVDFQPGVSMQVGIATSAKSDIDGVRKALTGLEGLTVQSAGERGTADYIIRVRQHTEENNYAATVEASVKTKLGAVYGVQTLEFKGTTSVGPRFSSSLTQQAFFLVGLALIFISIYVWIRFRLGFAVGAMVATIHDTAFLIGFIGITQMEITSATIAAVLTIIGYSLNDTIVVFDRIRENEKTSADQSLGSIIDASVNQTLSRTIMTSLTTLLAVVSIAIFTQGEIQNFAVALIVGILVGTYSSIFIAAPVLLEWRAAASRRKKKKEGKGGSAGSGVAVASSETEVEDPSEVDADAIAAELRKQRTEKKKF